MAEQEVGTKYIGLYENNIDCDPLFTDKEKDDFHLSDSSLCIGAGTDSVNIENVWYRIPSCDFDGNPRCTPSGFPPDLGAYENSLKSPVTDVDEELTTPGEFAVYQNYPNPFNPTTTIKYSIPAQTVGNENFRSVHLIVYDVLGREIATLINEEKPAGNYEVTWNAANLPSGVYLYQLKAGNFTAAKKLLLIK